LITPALLAQYADIPARPRVPTVEVRLMIFPDFAGTMYRPAATQQRYAPVKFTSRT